MKYLTQCVLLLLLLIASTSSCALENIFYVLRFTLKDRPSTPSETYKSLKKNYKKIDLLIPMAYVIDQSGNVSKNPDPKIVKFAREHSLKIMPLVTNTRFDPIKTRQFLSDPNAESASLKTLIDLCKKNNFYGAQFDFEMIPINDRELLTHFFELATNEFHQNGLPISFAIAPVVAKKTHSPYLKKVYEVWEGAYDVKKLGKIADFVSIMTYEQHTESTTPGPNASLPWVHQAIRYALHYIPANKISLGIDDATTHWYIGPVIKNKIHFQVQQQAISYHQAMLLVRKHRAVVLWDNQSSTPMAFYSNNWLNEYLFIEDSKSMALKYNLAKEYKLRGISVFDLGTEDPRIWEFL